MYAEMRIYVKEISGGFRISRGGGCVIPSPPGRGGANILFDKFPTKTAYENEEVLVGGGREGRFLRPLRSATVQTLALLSQKLNVKHIPTCVMK